MTILRYCVVIYRDACGVKQDVLVISGCPDCWAKKDNTIPEQDCKQQFRYRRTQARSKCLEEHTG